jgi:two-component system KDP operon response regulator KdpE
VEGGQVTRVLYIDSDGSGADHLSVLSQGGFSVERVSHLWNINGALDRWVPDLVVVSCGSVDAAVLRVCAGLRQVSAVPLVVCSQSSREADIVQVFDAGADDYLVTPIRPVELHARLRAVLRRTADTPVTRVQAEALIAGDLEVRLKEHKVYRKGEHIDLSPMEFRLLCVLVQETGRAVSHARLIANVWGPEYVDCRHYLRLYVKYLRSKVEDNPKNPRMILSEWGVGYRFEPALS